MLRQQRCKLVALPQLLPALGTDAGITENPVQRCGHAVPTIQPGREAGIAGESASVCFRVGFGLSDAVWTPVSSLLIEPLNRLESRSLKAFGGAKRNT